MKRKSDVSHAFVICAYRESRYLEECIQSLLNQTVKSQILIATSTPNDHIQKLAEKYGLEVHIHQEKSSLAGDWNFALQIPDVQLVTIAHQDDVYFPGYLESVLRYYHNSKSPVILFTDYYELREGKTVKSNQLLRVKRLLLSPLRMRRLWNSRFVRRRILSLGSAICCPSVTLVKDRISGGLFKDNMKSNIDWQAWEELSREKGDFVYVPYPLMGHRIHEESTTSELLAQSARRKEDLYMYRKFWPGLVAEFIEFFYCKNEKSNQIHIKRSRHDE